MLYDDYLNYQANYVQDAKIIIEKSHFYNLNENKDDLHIREMGGNFALFFNEDGKLTESKHYRSNEVTVKYTYEDFDIDANLIRIEECNGFTKCFNEITTLFYDIHNRIALEKIEDELEEIKIQITRIYLGNKKITFYDNINSKNYEGYTVQEYANNKLIREKEYLTDKTVCSDKRYSYNTEKNIITEAEYHMENEISSSEEFYNESGLLIGFRFDYEGKSIFRKYEYVFNERNHWITKMVTDNGEPRFVTDREIEYY